MDDLHRRPFFIPLRVLHEQALADQLVTRLIAGASAVGIGTALFYDPLISHKINQGILNYLQRHELNEVAQLVGTLVLLIFIGEALREAMDTRKG